MNIPSQHFAFTARDLFADADFPTPDECRVLGETLHKKMNEAIAEAGVVLPDHPEDHEHDAAVGAALALIQRGQVNAGVLFYNKWADAAGYPPIELRAFNPPRVDLSPSIGGMIAELRDGDVAILSVGDWVRPGYIKIKPSMFSPIARWGDVVPQAPMREKRSRPAHWDSDLRITVIG